MERGTWEARGSPANAAAAPPSPPRCLLSPGSALTDAPQPQPRPEKRAGRGRSRPARAPRAGRRRSSAARNPNTKEIDKRLPKGRAPPAERPPEGATRRSPAPNEAPVEGGGMRGGGLAPIRAAAFLPPSAVCVRGAESRQRGGAPGSGFRSLRRRRARREGPPGSPPRTQQPGAAEPHSPFLAFLPARPPPSAVTWLTFPPLSLYPPSLSFLPFSQQCGIRRPFPARKKVRACARSLRTGAPRSALCCV